MRLQTVLHFTFIKRNIVYAALFINQEASCEYRVVCLKIQEVLSLFSPGKCSLGSMFKTELICNVSLYRAIRCGGYIPV